MNMEASSEVQVTQDGKKFELVKKHNCSISVYISIIL